MVRIKRLELLRLAAPEPKSGVSANSTISACGHNLRLQGVQHKKINKSSKKRIILTVKRSTLSGACSTISGKAEIGFAAPTLIASRPAHHRVPFACGRTPFPRVLFSLPHSIQKRATFR